VLTKLRSQRMFRRGRTGIHAGVSTSTLQISVPFAFSEYAVICLNFCAYKNRNGGIEVWVKEHWSSIVLQDVKLLIFSDLQATSGHERCRNNPNVALQHWRVTKFFKDALAIYKEHECDGVIDLGDTTDDRSSIPVPTLDALMTGIGSFPDSPWNIKIVGNHEQYVRDGSVNTGRLFEHKFTVVEGMKVFKYNSTHKLVFVSFGVESAIAEFLQATTQKYAETHALALFGHFQVQGSMMTGGASPSGIAPALLKPFDMALLGHVHKPQSLLPTAHYVGSPFQQNYGESGEDKRVGIFDLDTLTMTWVPLTGYPRYRVINWEEWEGLDFTSEDRVKVILRTQEQAAAFYAHPQCAWADEAIYEFERPADSGAVVKVEEGGWSQKNVLGRYVDLNAPAFKLPVPLGEFIEIGKGVGGITD